ncbi:MAG TPA: phosphoribosylanthranilate isomerase [Acidimicrobiia bacterium]
MFVKICGVNSLEAVDAAANGGADAVGFVFADSPRQVSALQARALARCLPADVVKVAVFRRPQPQVLEEVLELVEPDWVQADAGSLLGLELPEDVDLLPVHRSGGPTAAEPPLRLLYEGTVSGRGVKADWHQARELAGSTQLILAGGLDPGNVADAIQAVGPWGVDVSSGVETEPGRKDPSRIAAFIANARAVFASAPGRTHAH